jgi:NAD(P)-dependent dehydrogenase (short-subunit alcohol dehydrogenase family)
VPTATLETDQTASRSTVVTERFVGKHVVVTGGASGIGLATARRFIDDGCTELAIIDMNAERLGQAAADLGSGGAKIRQVQADIGTAAACRDALARAIASWPRLDVLVSNAAMPADAVPFIDTPIESWDIEIAVNLTASFVLGQEAARSMASSGGGSILYTASISALGASRGYVGYNVTKAGIVSLVKQMAVELAPLHIRVNAVSPGPADTPRSTDLVGAKVMEQMREHFPGIPMDRLVKAEEIADAFAFLASDEASFITGQNLVVDGGLTSQVYDVPEDD